VLRRPRRVRAQRRRRLQTGEQCRIAIRLVNDDAHQLFDRLRGKIVAHRRRRPAGCQRVAIPVGGERDCHEMLAETELVESRTGAFALERVASAAQLDPVAAFALHHRPYPSGLHIA